MAHTNNKETFRVMEELANTTIALNNAGRLLQISYCRIDQQLEYNISKLREKFSTFHLTGSVYEGIPTLFCNDRDKMRNRKMFPTVECEPPDGRERLKYGYVLAESCPEPAYLKLKAVDTEWLCGKKVRPAIDKDGYLNVVNFLKVNMQNVDIDYEINGPATTFNAKHPSVIKDVDIVLCLKSNSWPPVSKSFFTRERLNNWSTNILEKIQNDGCLVVPVGRHNSACKDIEWRWSFSLAERELLQEMNGSLPECMLVLKALKRKYINYEESDKPKPFCSYYIKTACLWVYETFPHEDYGIMDLVRKLLNWLIDRYEHGNLPHYFIRSQNLIGHLSKKVRYEVQEKLKTVNSQNLWKMVMSCVTRFNYEGEIINSMCDKLGIAKVSEGDDYEQLEANLLHHPRAKEEIENAIRHLSPCGFMYDKSQRVNIVKWLSSECPKLIVGLQKFVGTRQTSFTAAQTSTILAIPEEVILPIIYSIDDLLPDGYGQMFRQYLYRHLGDVYAYLFSYLLTRGFPFICPDLHLCWLKPNYYYTLGAEMVFPDTWSDHGVGGLVLRAKFFYLTNDYKNLKEVLIDVERRIKSTKKSEEYMNRYINIQLGSPLHLPARVALKEGDMEKASANLKDMRECATMISSIDLKKSTMSLIKIIEKQVNPPNTTGIYKFQLTL
ncbi:uncharacterized protein LOC117120258 isoform X2 [Anneissia japonica]|uniref:uncharacterized protein LOC117120258 isoform X2 n=1 Tax=Anneissia japonica TaxID=1529436 RepID=UPI00142589CF|nr:uncharacterized protein LOC117120258 isoform X2 [Anneissia japonica]